jgi:hypothetical protein
MTKARKALDTFSRKRGPGRPANVEPSAIWGRAENYRGILKNVWEKFSAHLLNAEGKDDVVRAIQAAMPGENEFTPLASLIFTVVKGRDFPKTQKGQISFLADSVASLGLVSPRRSRDICTAERAKRKRANHILRAELYVECSCGYKGHSLDHACRKCGTAIPVWLVPGWSLP